MVNISYIRDKMMGWAKCGRGGNFFSGREKLKKDGGLELRQGSLELLAKLRIFLSRKAPLAFSAPSWAPLRPDWKEPQMMFTFCGEPFREAKQIVRNPAKAHSCLGTESRVSEFRHPYLPSSEFPS